MAHTANELTASTSLKPAETVTKFRRIVTGHDSSGKAIIIEDQICPNAHCMGIDDEFVCTEMWRTAALPTSNAGEYVDPSKEFSLSPTSRGTVFRMLEIPPLHKVGAKSELCLHRTVSVDYAVVIKGTTVAVLEDGVETVMNAGDVLIQRGTLHGWDNRTDEPVVILFVLCGAEELPGLPPC